MKNLQIISLMALLVLVVVVQGSATSPTSTRMNPITIVKKYYDALNAGKLETAADQLAKDVLCTSPEGRFQGKDACRQYLKSLITRGIRQVNENYRESKGEVRYDYKWYTGSALVGSGNDGLTIVKDGKILFDGYEKDKPK